MFKILAEPVADRLFFAGEVTSPEYATVHGAFKSGYRVAEEVLFGYFYPYARL